jgi:hypothetical protein
VLLPVAGGCTAAVQAVPAADDGRRSAVAAAVAAAASERGAEVERAGGGV